MTDDGTPESRLAAVVSVWARSEIERLSIVGSVHSELSRGSTVWMRSLDGSIRSQRHTPYCCGGFKGQGTEFTGWQSTIEDAGRALVSELAEADFMFRPGILVWRDFPEILRDESPYRTRWNAYCRFSLVRTDGEVLLSDPEEAENHG